MTVFHSASEGSPIEVGPKSAIIVSLILDMMELTMEHLLGWPGWGHLETFLQPFHQETLSGMPIP